MADSDVAICNLALQKLGASRIASLSEDSTNAIELNACYVHLLKTELRRHKWNFAIKRDSLAASSVEPDFDYDYAYPLPNDCLRLLPPAVRNLDWKIESHEGSNVVLTNDGAPLEIVYIAYVTDPTKYDDCFTEMLACRIADHLSEKLTGSTSKGEKAMREYALARAEARRMNAFENISEDAPADDWVAARR
jgi:hypothetical protein